MLRRAGEAATKRCVDARGYPQQPRLIGVIHVPVEWPKPIHSQGEGEEEESGEEIRTQESFGNEGLVSRTEKLGLHASGSKFLLL